MVRTRPPWHLWVIGLFFVLATYELAADHMGVDGLALQAGFYVGEVLRRAKRVAVLGHSRLGLSVDWSLLYATIDERSRRISQRAFLRNVARGEAYSQEAPTMWDVDFQTAVAQAEMEDRERPGAYHQLAFHRTDGTEILVRDLTGSGYVARTKPRFASVDAARSIDDVAERVKALFLAKDRAGEFLRATLGPTLLYAARIAPDIATSIDDVDRAMRWGFGWQLGPFETWDAIGIQEVLSALQVDAVDAPELVAGMLAAGRNTLRAGPLPPADPAYDLLGTARRSAAKATSPLRANAGASLVDLGDGVLCVEFHSKMNAIGGDTVQMLQAGVREAARNFAALVVGRFPARVRRGGRESRIDERYTAVWTRDGGRWRLRHEHASPIGEGE